MNLKNRFSLFVAISFFISLTLSACSSEDKPDEQTATKSISINTILDDYFEESTVLSSNFAIFRGDYRFNNTWVNYLSDEYLQKKHQLTKKYLALIENNYQPKSKSVLMFCCGILT